MAVDERAQQPRFAAEAQQLALHRFAVEVESGKRGQSGRPGAAGEDHLIAEPRQAGDRFAVAQVDAEGAAGVAQCRRGAARIDLSGG